MLWIGILMLARDRTRFLTLLAGLSFVSLLFIQQSATFCALITRSARSIDAVNAPLWIADPQLRTVDDNKPLLDTDLERIRSVSGVLWAEPLLIRNVDARVSRGVLPKESSCLASMPRRSSAGPR